MEKGVGVVLDGVACALVLGGGNNYPSTAVVVERRPDVVRSQSMFTPGGPSWGGDMRDTKLAYWMYRVSLKINRGTV